jgi:hypothetical protein
VNSIATTSLCLPRWMCRALLSSLLGMFLLQGIGCSKPATTAEVSGSVTVDGEPAETGAIGFFSVDGKSPTSGGEIKEGRYTAQVPFGKMKVEVRVPKVVGHQKLYDTPDSKTQPVMQETLPEKFNDQTELRIDVQPGTNEHDFDLNTTQ